MKEVCIQIVVRNDKEETCRTVKTYWDENVSVKEIADLLVWSIEYDA